MFSMSRIASDVCFINHNDPTTAFAARATKVLVTDLPLSDPDPMDQIDISMDATKSTGMPNTNTQFNRISSNNNVDHDTNPDKLGLDLLNLTSIDQTRHA